MKISNIPALLVVARYNEDISWLSNVYIPNVVYDKGEKSENGVGLKNVGLDSGTYLTFITENYKNLPDRVFFTQGNPFDHVTWDNFFFLLGKWSQGGIVQSGCPIFRISPINTHWSEESDNHNGLAPYVAATWTKIFGSDIPEIIYYPAGQIFGLSKKRILARSLESWKMILDSVCSERPESCPKTDNHRPGCACLSEFSPYCIERLWFYL